jgi:hypothetical protein
MKILFTNHSQQQCGVYQYGARTAKILESDPRFLLLYVEVDNPEQLYSAVAQFEPDVILLNWALGTQPWLSGEVLNSLNSKKVVFYHDDFNDHLRTFNADAFIVGSQDENDPSRPSENKYYVLPRPIVERDVVEKERGDIISVGSFGTGSTRKGFQDVVTRVCNEYDEAIINFHITGAYFDYTNGATALAVSDLCRQHVTKPGIQLNITNDFITDEELALRLQQNDINIFMYTHEVPHFAGIASSLDFPVGWGGPIATNGNIMFRHVLKDYPEINLDNHSIEEVLALGNRVSLELREQWSNKNLRDKIYQITQEI